MLYLVWAIGLATAYINGMHDGGTIVATTVTARILPPRKAVILCGTASFLGALLLGEAVAKTMAYQLVDTASVLSGGTAADAGRFLISIFIGSMIWNMVTWFLKLPSSASHCLIGSMVGCTIAAIGVSGVYWNAIGVKVILAMFISPLVGFVLGYLLLLIQNKLLARATMAWKPWIRRLELGSTVLLALSYGSNEAQKIAGLLFLAEVTLPALPGPGFLSSLPVILAGAALAAGTMTGGYNMMSTVGRRIVKINMDRALSSQLASVMVVEFANVTGLPISCTQVVTGSVMGVGTEDRPRSVNWGITLRILASWILTLPAAALCGSAVYLLLHL